LEERGESPDEKMANLGIHTERNPDGECVQEESRASASAPTSSAARSYGFAVSKSGHGGEGSICDPDLADH
jgi:hypothetical protein